MTIYGSGIRSAAADMFERGGLGRDFAVDVHPVMQSGMGWQ